MALWGFEAINEGSQKPIVDGCKSIGGFGSRTVASCLTGLFD
jgi:hypothetical protein